MSIMKFFHCGYLQEPQNKTLCELSTVLRKKKNGGFYLTAINQRYFWICKKVTADNGFFYLPYNSNFVLFYTQ